MSKEARLAPGLISGLRGAFSRAAVGSGAAYSASRVLEPRRSEKKRIYRTLQIGAAAAAVPPLARGLDLAISRVVKIAGVEGDEARVLRAFLSGIGERSLVLEKMGDEIMSELTKVLGGADLIAALFKGAKELPPEFKKNMEKTKEKNKEKGKGKEDDENKKEDKKKDDKGKGGKEEDKKKGKKPWEKKEGEILDMIHMAEGESEGAFVNRASQLCATAMVGEGQRFEASGVRRIKKEAAPTHLLSALKSTVQRSKKDADFLKRLRVLLGSRRKTKVGANVEASPEMRRAALKKILLGGAALAGGGYLYGKAKGRKEERERFLGPHGAMRTASLLKEAPRTSTGAEPNIPAKVKEIADALRRDKPNMPDSRAYRIAWSTYKKSKKSASFLEEALPEPRVIQALGQAITH